LNDEVRRRYEPYSSSVVKRLCALKKLHDAGAKTWVSVEPIFPSLKETNPIDIIEALADDIADQFVFGKLNYQNAPEDFYREIMPKIISKCQKLGVKFFVKRELRELLG
jgi:DNA repair photolyase